MRKENEPEDSLQLFSMERVSGYTDAVFAIAVTLLVLDLTTQALGQVNSDASLWQSLVNMQDQIVGFVVSFLLLSMLWVTHLRQFQLIARADTGLLWLNNFRLLFVVLIPFSTSLQADYSQYLAGRILLPINLLLATLLGALCAGWSVRHRNLLKANITHLVLLRAEIASWTAVGCGCLAVVLSIWFGPWGFVAYFLAGPINAIALRRLESKDPAALLS